MPIIESGLERSKGTDPLDNSRDSSNELWSTGTCKRFKTEILSHLSVFQWSKTLLNTFNTDLENLGSISLILPPLTSASYFTKIGEIIKWPWIKELHGKSQLILQAVILKRKCNLSSWDTNSYLDLSCKCFLGLFQQILSRNKIIF